MSLFCGRCEKPLEGHDEKACARKMSRRWFLGAAVGAVAGVVVAPALPKIIAGVDLTIPGTDQTIKIATSRYLYRIPLEIYRGGKFHKIEMDGGPGYIKTLRAGARQWVIDDPSLPETLAREQERIEAVLVRG